MSNKKSQTHSTSVADAWDECFTIKSGRAVRLTELAVFFAISAVSAIYLLSFASYGINIWDEGVLYSGAQRMLDGEWPYKDFYGYPPARYILIAWVFQMFGHEAIYAKYLYSALTGFMPGMAYLSARRFMGREWSALAAILMLSAPAVIYNRFLGFFTLLCLLATFRVHESPGRKNAGLWLLAMAAAFVFEYELVPVSIVAFAVILLLSKRDSIAGHLRRYSPKPAFRIGAGLAVLGLAAILYAARNVITFQMHLLFGTRDVWGNPFPSLLENAPGYLSFAALENGLFYLPPLLCGALLAKALLAPGMRRGHELILAYFGFMVFGLMIWRAGFDNLIRTFPVPYVIAAYFSSELYRLITSRLAAGAIAAGAPFHKILSAVMLAVILAPAAVFMTDMTLRNGYYAGSIGAKRESTELVDIRGIYGIHLDGFTKNIVQQSVPYAAGRLKNGETIFVIPLNPLWYFMLERKNPTYYEWILPGMMTPEREEDIIALLKSADVRYIFYIDIAIDNRDERRFRNYAPRVMDYIRKNYVVMGVAGGFLQVLEHAKNRPGEDFAHFWTPEAEAARAAN